MLKCDLNRTSTQLLKKIQKSQKIKEIKSRSLLEVFMQKEFEDTKGVIRIHKLKKNRQHNGEKKKYKRTNNDLQNIDIKLKIE